MQGLKPGNPIPARLDGRCRGAKISLAFRRFNLASLNAIKHQERFKSKSNEDRHDRPYYSDCGR